MSSVLKRKGAQVLVGVALATSALMGPSPALSAIIADSVADFSSTQGYLGWQYGYFDGALTSSTFKELSWHPCNGRWETPNYACTVSYWTMLNQIGGSPNVHHVEQWAVRRWTSNFTGDVTISGILNDLDRNGGVSGPGDGMTGRIFVDGLELYSLLVDHSSPSAGFQYQLSLSLVAGQIVDFAIDPNATDRDDTAQFTSRIEASLPPSTGTESVPGPIPLLALTSAFYWTRRLRKRIKNNKATLRIASTD